MSYICSVCGQEHDGLPALAFLQPDYWLALTPDQRAQGELGTDDCLTPDGHFFIRCSLNIPIKDRPEETLSFGIWSTLSESNYLRYADAFHDADQSKLGPMFGWLSNELTDEFAGSTNLKCEVCPQDNRQRPLIVLERTEHPLALAQREGISFARVHRLLHDHGIV